MRNSNDNFLITSLWSDSKSEKQGTELNLAFLCLLRRLICNNDIRACEVAIVPFCFVVFLTRNHLIAKKILQDRNDANVVCVFSSVFTNHFLFSF